MIQVRIPVEKDESIYGFWLQFDGIKKSKKVLDLNVDHWSRGGGRTHAPVPFYISSKGYGILFNTARFLKVHVQVGNRKELLELCRNSGAEVGEGSWTREDLYEG